MRQKKQVICRFLMFALRQLHRCKRQVDLAEVIPHFKVNTKKHFYEIRLFWDCVNAFTIYIYTTFFFFEQFFHSILQPWKTT